MNHSNINVYHVSDVKKSTLFFEVLVLTSLFLIEGPVCSSNTTPFSLPTKNDP